MIFQPYGPEDPVTMAPLRVEVDALDDLLALPLVSRFTCTNRYGAFDRFSFAPFVGHRPRRLVTIGNLMAEYANGAHWRVVGSLSEWPQGLPEWDRMGWYHPK